MGLGVCVWESDRVLVVVGGGKNAHGKRVALRGAHKLDISEKIITES